MSQKSTPVSVKEAMDEANFDGSSSIAIAGTLITNRGQCLLANMSFDDVKSTKSRDDLDAYFRLVVPGLASLIGVEFPFQTYLDGAWYGHCKPVIVEAIPYQLKGVRNEPLFLTRVTRIEFLKSGRIFDEAFLRSACPIEYEAIKHERVDVLDEDDDDWDVTTPAEDWFYHAKLVVAKTTW